MKHIYSCIISAVAKTFTLIYVASVGTTIQLRVTLYSTIKRCESKFKRDDLVVLKG